MGSECTFLNPLHRHGTSQRQRLVAALEPSSVSVDERGVADLVNYAREYAALLRFYGPDNVGRGDWVEFIEHDITTLVALIGATDVEERRADFDEKRSAVLSAGAAFRAGAYALLLEEVVRLARTIDTWYVRAVDGLALAVALKRLIGSALGPALRDLLAQVARADEVGVPVDPVSVSSFDSAWGLVESEPHPGLFPSEDPTSADEMKAAVAATGDAFRILHDGLAFLVSNAPGYLDETLTDYPEHEPHVALFLAFLGIFHHAQDSINTLTAAHLDFYYKEVLQLDRRAATPDKVHLVFELAKTAASHLVKKDTYLKAGKDNTGVELLYATDRELAVNKASVDEKQGLASVYVDRDADGTVENIYAAPTANSADGLGAEIEEEDGKWPTFGSDAMPPAKLGFAVASPMFRLAESTRRITVRWQLSQSSLFFAGELGNDVAYELHHNVAVSASGAKEWLDVEIEGVEVSDGTSVHRSGSVADSGDPNGTPYVRYGLLLEGDAAAVVDFDADTLSGGYATDFPVLRFTLDNEGLPAEVRRRAPTAEVSDFSDTVASYTQGTVVRFDGKRYQAQVDIDQPARRPPNYDDLWDLVPSGYPYKYFEEMEVRRLQIDVDVDGMKSLVLESDVGVLDPAKPFLPFGPAPRAGSSLLIGSPEVFQKSVTKLELDVEWADLPQTDFASHYSNYSESTTPASNDYFTADFEVLDSGAWSLLPGGDDEPLFDSGAAAPPTASPHVFALGAAPLARDAGLKGFTRFGTSLRQGFMRVKLNQNFLHDRYASELALKAAIPETNPAEYPLAPYTPLFASLELSYEAREIVEYSATKADDFDDRVEQVFQIGHFGQREVYPIADDASADDVPISRTLVPEYRVNVRSGNTAVDAPAQGTLYIGLKDLKPPQNLSLLLRVAEGSEAPSPPAPQVVWSYWAEGAWTDFGVTELVSDGTNGLLRSGVVALAMPKTMKADTTLLPGKLHWIKAAVAKDSGSIPKMIAVHAQAVTASFRDQGNDPLHVSQPLKAETISKLRSRDAAIKSVTQPYASFGGRVREPDNAFYTRVSERLRHKGRAVTIFDYERLVLEAFPEVYKVKCFNHTCTTSEYAPGHVKLVVVPDLRNANAVDPLRPRLSQSTLEKIQKWLKPLASDFVDIQVVNPEYEEIRVRFKVRFHAGRDRGLYTAKLEQEIIRSLSPWLYDEAADLVFGGRVHRSSILHHVEKQEYVDFVVDFEMDHIAGNVTKRNLEEVAATRSSVALVSAKTHEIGGDVASCLDSPALAVTCDEAPMHPAPRYLGNKRSLELHDLLNLTVNCQVDEIAPERRTYFGSVADAVAAGYDYCAYCFSRELSQR